MRPDQSRSAENGKTFPKATSLSVRYKFRFWTSAGRLKKTISERLNLLGVTDHVTVRRFMITENFFSKKIRGAKTFFYYKI